MQDFRNHLKTVIQDLYGLDFDPDFTPSPENINADYSTNAPLKLAKELRKNPMEIATEIAGELGGRERSSEQIAFPTPPGFLNFTLSDTFLQTGITAVVTDFEQFIYSGANRGQTVICEFSDPNPFKVLHVGHLYTSIVGDAIARLYEYSGAKVIRANFGGDVGLHVAKTMYVLAQKDPADLTIEDIAKCYVEGTALYDDDPAAHAKITELNQAIYRINAEDDHSTPLARLYWQGRELSYQYFNDFYDQIGVHFDKYYPESTVANLGLAKVKEQLERGIYEYSDGAVIFNGEKYGLHTRVFINQAGVPTYETKDVGLIFAKDRDYHFDKSIVITGGEQKDYMAVVLKSIEQYAPALVEKTTHLTHGLVKLKGGVKMSSRKGNFLKAVDVLDLVRAELKSQYGSEDNVISLAAIKYAFLKYKMGGDIIFDPEDSVKMTGNSGPYLLYSAVRAKKILDKVTVAGRRVTPSEGDPHGASSDVGEETTAGPVATAPEHNLAKKLLEYKGVLDEAVAEMAPHKLATYLYELSQSFSRFYEHCPVAGTPEESERANLVKAYLNVMTHGLGLLGIDIPEEM